MPRFVTAPRRAATLLLALGLGPGLLACGGPTVSERCREQTAQCIRRCERATPDTGEPARTSPANSTMTECEIRCGCGGGEAKPRPMGKPTYTGSENER